MKVALTMMLDTKIEPGLEVEQLLEELRSLRADMLALEARSMPQIQASSRRTARSRSSASPSSTRGSLRIRCAT